MRLAFIYRRIKIKATPRQGPCESRQVCSGHLLPVAIFYNKCMTTIRLILQTKVKVTDYNIQNDVIRWRISTSLNVIGLIFATALTVSEILTFQVCDIETIGQGHEVQQSQWFHSMANIKLF